MKSPVYKTYEKYLMELKKLNHTSIAPGVLEPLTLDEEIKRVENHLKRLDKRSKEE